MVRIGLIDSGVSESLSSSIVAGCGFPLREGRVVRVEDSIEDSVGHGTFVAEIIAARVPDVSLLLARVFFDRLVATPAQVATALDWLVEQDVRLVNMSFGLAADREVLALSCVRALDAGCLLVSAAPARGNSVYPAGYPGVIRATGDARCEPGEISFLNSEQADFGGHVLANDGTTAGASIGCAWVSSMLASLLSKHADAQPGTLIDMLIKDAAYTGPEQRSD